MSFDLFLKNIFETIPAQIWMVFVFIFMLILLICSIVTFCTLNLLKRKREMDDKFKEIPWNYTDAIVTRFLSGEIDSYGAINTSGEEAHGLKMLVSFKTKDEIVEKPCRSKIKMRNLWNKRYRDRLINTTIRIQYKEIVYKGKRAFLIYNCDE